MEPTYHETLPGNVEILRWPHPRALAEDEVVRFFTAKGLRYTRWSNGPGDTYGVHTHDYRKTLFCISGTITFSLPDLSREVFMNPGDRLTLPPGIRHGAVVGRDGVACIEAPG